MPQLTGGVGDSSCLPVSEAVAVLGCCIVSARTVQGMARVRLGQAPAWPLVPDRRGHKDSAVEGGRRPFPEETRSALDIEGKHVTIQGPDPEMSPAAAYAPSACAASAPSL